MAAINQRIPNFLGGVSQQPDTIKFPGQLSVCDNAYPDVTFGLTKRPPGEFVAKLSGVLTGTTYWYESVRDGDEKFLMQIKVGGGASGIKVWTLTDIQSSATFYENVSGYSAGDLIPAGTAMTVTVNDSGYLTQTDTSLPTGAFSIQTIQDTTIIANPNKKVESTGTIANLGTNLTGDYCFARLDTLAYNTEYVLYKGEAPSPGTKFRVTSVQARHNGKSSFDEPDDSTQVSGGVTDSDVLSNKGSNHEHGKYTGMCGFGDNEQSDTTQGDQRATGHVTVNSNAWIHKQVSMYQSDNSTGIATSGNGVDYRGTVPYYKSTYIGTATLKDGGRYSSDPYNTDLVVEGNSETHVTIGSDSSNGTKDWEVRCTGSQAFDTYEGVSNVAYYRTPKNPDSGTLSISAILRGLRDSIVNDNKLGSGMGCIIIGNGLFIYGTGADEVNFLGGTINEGMNVFAKSVTDVSKLPSSCYDGYTVKVDNSENTDADNYFLKFIADAGTQGSGTWEECARPENWGSSGQVRGFTRSTMPHYLKNNRDGTFTFDQLPDVSGEANNPDIRLEWKIRDVGSIETNPLPSFVTTDNNNPKSIQNIFFHRNRLGFISGENVVLSRPHDYFNFFSVSAITTSDDNPIDVTVSDTKPAFIRHTLPIQKGVMMLSDNGQFLLFTESDIFSPKTARLKKIASYECDATIKPVDMGTTVMWVSTVGAYTRTFEAVILDDEAPPRVIEQTRVVPEYLPNDINLAANSSALGLVAYAKTGQDDSQVNKNIYFYKYFDSGEKRDQSSWFSWTVTGRLQHALFSGGNLYTVTEQINSDEYILSRHEFVSSSNANSSYVLGGSFDDVGLTTKTARWFEACLDHLETKTSGWSYDSATGKSSVPLAHNPGDSRTSLIYLVVLKGDEAGSVVRCSELVESGSGASKSTVAKFVINLTSGVTSIAVGYKYDTLIELPTFYPSVGEARDVDGDLRISGINFEMGVSGPMEFELSSKYGDIDTYTQYESGMLVGTGQFSEPPAVLNKSVRVPIQRKNEKYKLQIKIPDPFSTALISASWDGRYNTKRHVRR